MVSVCNIMGRGELMTKSCYCYLFKYFLLKLVLITFVPNLFHPFRYHTPSSNIYEESLEMIMRL